MIEIPYMPSGKHGFIIRTDNKTHQQCLNYVPMPRAIIDKIYSANELDFVIICLRLINPSGRKKENKIIYFDVKSKKSTLQNSLICDEFDYALKFPNNDVVKLHLAKDDENDQT